MDWRGWLTRPGSTGRSGTPSDAGSLLYELEGHFQQPLYICSPETGTVTHWIHLNEKLFASKGLAVQSATFRVSENGSSVAVLEGTTTEGKAWKVEMKRGDAERKYLAGVCVGDAQPLGQIVHGKTMETGMACDSPQPTRARGLTQRRGRAESDAIFERFQ